LCNHRLVDLEHQPAVVVQVEPEAPHHIALEDLPLQGEGLMAPGLLIRDAFDAFHEPPSLEDFPAFLLDSPAQPYLCSTA
jgi:hypothetical protein